MTPNHSRTFTLLPLRSFAQLLQSNATEVKYLTKMEAELFRTLSEIVVLSIFFLAEAPSPIHLFRSSTGRKITFATNTAEMRTFPRGLITRKVFHGPFSRQDTHLQIVADHNFLSAMLSKITSFSSSHNIPNLKHRIHTSFHC